MVVPPPRFGELCRSGANVCAPVGKLKMAADGTHVGMHVAAARPVALSRDQVSPELIAKEREIAVEQAKATGKPQQIAEKIAEGKMNAFFGERVLLDQEFFNASVFKGTIANYLKQNGVTLEKYARVEVGQG